MIFKIYYFKLFWGWKIRSLWIWNAFTKDVRWTWLFWFKLSSLFDFLNYFISVVLLLWVFVLFGMFAYKQIACFHWYNLTSFLLRSNNDLNLLNYFSVFRNKRTLSFTALCFWQVKSTLWPFIILNVICAHPPLYVHTLFELKKYINYEN